MLNNLPDITGDENTVVFQQECELYAIKVCENDAYRWMTLGRNQESDLIQSLISLSEPGRVLLPYAYSMLLALISVHKPRRLLNRGSGCGTFERFFFKYYPDTSITSVESNADIINVSRKYFSIPVDYPVINESADVFLKKHNNKYDIVFCDVHDGNKHPDCLHDLNFYTSIKRCLSDGGAFVINLLPVSEQQLLDILLLVRKVFSWQHLLDFDNYGNIILYIYAQEPPLHSINVRCEELKIRTNVELADSVDRLTLLPVS